MCASACGMAAPLAQGASAFKGLAAPATPRLTWENKAGTLLLLNQMRMGLRNKAGPDGFSDQRRTDAMIAAFATLVFLATLWLLVVVGAAVLEESGARIAAALKGQSRTGRRIAVAPARTRTRTRVQAPLRARPRWRDAA